jgi:hypothetical protein
MKGEKRKHLEEDKGRSSSKRSRPVAASTTEMVTMTLAAHSSLLNELRAMRRRYGMMQAELQVRVEH